MCGLRAALYASNETAQALTADSIINMGTINRRFGTNADMQGGDVLLKGAGYYQITVDMNITAAAGTTAITFEKDGVPIPGAKISLTTTAQDYSISRSFMVRNSCPKETVITAVLGNLATAVNNIAVTVVKV